MKKIIIGLVGLILIIGAFLFFYSEKMVEVKVDEQIAILQASGFDIEEKTQDSDADSRHFVISLSDTDKFVTYYPKYKEFLIELLQKTEKDHFKDVKFGVDVTSFVTIVSADIYPLSFPKGSLSAKEAALFQTYVDEKVFLLKVDYNPITKGIDGVLKNVDEKNQNTTLKIEGLNFDAVLDDEMAFKYEVQNFILSDSSSAKVIDVQGFSSDFRYEGLHNELINGFGNIEKILIENEGTTINMNGFNAVLTSDAKNGFLDSGAKLTLKSMDIKVDEQDFGFNGLIFDYDIDNINLESFHKLMNFLEKSEADLEASKMYEIIQEIFSYGVVVELNKLSVDNIRHGKESVKGFSVEAKMNIPKEPEFSKNLETSPMLALMSLNVTSKVALSDELYAEIQKTPQAEMFIAMEAKNENGYRIYDIEFQDGSLSINGQSVM